MPPPIVPDLYVYTAMIMSGLRFQTQHEHENHCPARSRKLLRTHRRPPRAPFRGLRRITFREGGGIAIRVKLYIYIFLPQCFGKPNVLYTLRLNKITIIVHDLLIPFGANWCNPLCDSGGTVFCMYLKITAITRSQAKKSWTF